MDEERHRRRPDAGDIAFALEVGRRALRRVLSRSELLRRALGIPAEDITTSGRGVLLVQIDGLAFRQLQRAMGQGRMPFLQRLIQREDYRLIHTYSGLPSTTPAVQGELYYNLRGVVPAFAYLDREQQKFQILYDPDAAQRVEDELRARGDEPLLTGGSSWSNIFSGGADPRECHFCGVGLRPADIARRVSVLRILIAIIAHLPRALWTALLAILELLEGIGEGLVGMLRGRSPMRAIRTVISRVFVCTVLREIIEIGAGIDLARGLPVVHVNFLGYDERAHKFGPGNRAAFRELRGIDRSIRTLFGIARRSSRDYDIWIISDHGQEPVRSVARETEGGIGQIVYEGLETLGLRAQRSFRVLYESESRTWPANRDIQRELEDQEKPDAPIVQCNFAVVARGPVGHLYFSQPLDLLNKRKLAEWLVKNGKVPGVAFVAAPGEIIWIHANGEAGFPTDAAKVLPHEPRLRPELARDFVDLCKHKNSGDLLLLGWNPHGQSWSFPVEHGAHAGPGIDEVRGFALLPPGTRLPATANEVVRPSVLRAGILHVLGRRRIEASGAARPESRKSLRILTYNIHSCVGLDGRLSPSRIASIIRAFDPDIVALQEVDIRRARSRGEDQTKRLADDLEMESAFCCTVERSHERYGHALFTRFPMEIIASRCYACDPGDAMCEPRGMLMAKVQAGAQSIYVANTHLGLTNAERIAQVKELLGPNWLGGLPGNAPVIFCGDFNMRPGSEPYRLLASRFQDAALCVRPLARLATFAAPFPIARIDYVFLSPHFTVENLRVPRNSLTSVASDHLPVVADLRIENSEGRQ